MKTDGVGRRAWAAGRGAGGRRAHGRAALDHPAPAARLLRERCRHVDAGPDRSGRARGAHRARRPQAHRRPARGPRVLPPPGRPGTGRPHRGVRPRCGAWTSRPCWCRPRRARRRPGEEVVMADWARFREPEPSEAGALETVDAALAAQLHRIDECPVGSLGRPLLQLLPAVGGGAVPGEGAVATGVLVSHDLSGRGILSGWEAAAAPTSWRCRPWAECDRLRAPLLGARPRRWRITRSASWMIVGLAFEGRGALDRPRARRPSWPEHSAAGAGAGLRLLGDRPHGPAATTRSTRCTPVCGDCGARARLMSTAYLPDAWERERANAGAAAALAGLVFVGVSINVARVG